MKRTRREMLGAAMLGLGGGFGVPASAAVLATPRQSEGPFYPAELPLDSDNNLVEVDGADGIAAGEIANIIGRVQDTHANPIANAKVEIWQCNAFGRYHHPRDRSSAPTDPNFQGYGSTLTDSQGRYRFRTIKPVPYPGRAPHIHFSVSAAGRPRLVTQLYVQGEPDNEDDGLLGWLSPAAREQLIRPFEPDAQAPGELLASFDLVLAT